MADCNLKENKMLDNTGKFDAAKLKSFLKDAVKDAKYVITF